MDSSGPSYGPIAVIILAGLVMLGDLAFVAAMARGVFG
jgi:hypothetical protein